MSYFRKKRFMEKVGDKMDDVAVLTIATLAMDPIKAAAQGIFGQSNKKKKKKKKSKKKALTSESSLIKEMIKLAKLDHSKNEKKTVTVITPSGEKLLVCTKTGDILGTLK